MADSMFTPFVREHHPLARLLDEWSSTARINCHGVDHVQFEAESEEELIEHLLTVWRQHAVPRLARIGDPRIRGEPIPTGRRDLDTDERLSVWRWSAWFSIVGNSDVLTAWPEQLVAEPCGDSSDWLPVPSMYWRMTNDGPVVHIDIPMEEDPKGETAPSKRYVDAAAYLDAAIAAANEQIETYERQLRDELGSTLQGRRARLGVISAQHAQVIELLRVPTPPLEFADDTEEPSAAHTPVAGAGDGQPIALGRLLHERSFRDLVDVTRRWGAGVERYPAAFAALGEEMLSSLLVPALNVAFDVAHREVFSVSGRTDIFVESVRNDRENAAYFGEAKVWSGKGGVPAELDQVLGYANGRVTEVMLLYFVRRKNFAKVQARCLDAIASYDGFRDWRDGDDRAALVSHPTFGQEVAVTLVLLHIPAAGNEDPDADDLAEVPD